jgi:hypothetical protein
MQVFMGPVETHSTCIVYFHLSLLYERLKFEPSSVETGSNCLICDLASVAIHGFWHNAIILNDHMASDELMFDLSSTRNTASKHSFCVIVSCKGKIVPVLNSLSTRPWRCIGAWMYSSIIRDLSIWWRRVVSFTLRPLYPRERAPSTNCIGG